MSGTIFFLELLSSQLGGRHFCLPTRQNRDSSAIDFLAQQKPNEHLPEPTPPTSVSRSSQASCFWKRSRGIDCDLLVSRQESTMSDQVRDRSPIDKDRKESRFKERNRRSGGTKIILQQFCTKKLPALVFMRQIAWTSLYLMRFLGSR